MKFIVDAQLPRRLAASLTDANHDALHTLDLPAGNSTTDAAITAQADAEQRIVITKDSDFVNSHLLHNKPARLLLVSTGNITNRELETLLLKQLPTIVEAFHSSVFIELGRKHLTIHH